MVAWDDGSIELMVAGSALGYGSLGHTLVLRVCPSGKPLVLWVYLVPQKSDHPFSQKANLAPSPDFSSPLTAQGKRLRQDLQHRHECAPVCEAVCEFQRFIPGQMSENLIPKWLTYGPLVGLWCFVDLLPGSQYVHWSFTDFCTPQPRLLKLLCLGRIPLEDGKIHKKKLEICW